MSPRAAAKAKSKSGMSAFRSLVKQATKQEPVGRREGPIPHTPTNIIQLDSVIGGRPTKDGKSMICPGIPKGRVIELYGPESSGKTTLALKVITAMQKQGGSAVFLDYEHALDHEYAQATGVDFSDENFSIYQPDTFEEGVKMIFLAAREKIDLVVIDSLAAMVPASELEKKVDDPAKIGVLAATVSKYLPRLNMRLAKSGTTLIIINQTRAAISTSGPSRGGDQENTPGGKALKFYSYLRLRTARIKTETYQKKDPVTLKEKKLPYGNLTEVKVVKNKACGTQGHKSEIFIRYGYGVDEYLSAIEGAVPRKLIQKSGSSYKLGNQTFKGREKLRAFLRDNPKEYEKIRAAIMKALLDEAKNIASVPDDVEDEDILTELGEDLSDDDLFEDTPTELEQSIEDLEPEAS